MAMPGRVRSSFLRSGQSIAEIIVVAVCVGALLLTLGAVRGNFASGTPQARCMFRLERLSAGLSMCATEHNGFVPTADDTETMPSIMYSWTDVLYDLNYVPSEQLWRCPADQHPGFPSEQRGVQWQMQFIDAFGVGEEPSPGVRTSYALNFVLAHGFPTDRFEDASRQVLAIDGWWSWFACMNASWVYGDQVLGQTPDPVNFPTWEGTMIGWRHGAQKAASTLYRDGHVARLVPRVPQNYTELRFNTIDTMQHFTWLPGEDTWRYSFDAYNGDVAEYEGREPYSGPSKYVAGERVDIDFPEELSAKWRTANDAWIRLPSDPADRY